MRPVQCPLYWPAYSFDCCVDTSTPALGHSDFRCPSSPQFQHCPLKECV